METSPYAAIGAPAFRNTSFKAARSSPPRAFAFSWCLPSEICDSIAIPAAATIGFELYVPFWATRLDRFHCASSPKVIMLRMSRRPQTAAPGSPPATILASVVMSGVTP